MSNQVILVDEQDRPTGTEEKLAAHRNGLLHRAFSVYVLNEEGKMLLQRRHPDKYHSGGLWSNACCSHPRPGEDTTDAAVRRLDEELGIHCAVQPAFEFTYRVEFGDLVEHEYDHVFLARYNDEPVPNPSEIDAVRWVTPEVLRKEVQHQPHQFTYWFRHSYERACKIARTASQDGADPLQ